MIKWSIQHEDTIFLMFMPLLTLFQIQETKTDSIKRNKLFLITVGNVNIPSFSRWYEQSDISERL